MSSILKVDEIQDTSGNNIINESSDTITIGASGDTISIPSGATIANSGTATGFGIDGITVADQWRLSADKANVDTSNTIFDSNVERVDTSGQGTIGSAMSFETGTGNFTFPTTGIYLVQGVVSYQKDSDRAYTGFKIQLTTNNSSYATICQSFGSINVVSSSATYTNVVASSLVDVTDTSNVKVRFSGSVPGAVTAVGSTSENHTFFTFIRLGDT